MNAKYIVGLSSLALALVLGACSPAPDAAVNVVEEPMVVEEEMVLDPEMGEELDINIVEEEMPVEDVVVEEEM